MTFSPRLSYFLFKGLEICLQFLLRHILHWFWTSSIKKAHIWQNAVSHDVVKMTIWLKKIEKKKQNIVTVPCSPRKDQILRIWYFHATIPNSDLNINNIAHKK